MDKMKNATDAVRNVISSIGDSFPSVTILKFRRLHSGDSSN
jgi:hypothetical protein